MSSKKALEAIDFQKYVDNEKENQFFYKIGLIGPSRVGKSSMLASLLEEAKTVFAQSLVSIEPFVDEDGISLTKDRIKNTINNIVSGLDYSTFDPGYGIGTADPFIFDLVIKISAEEKQKNKSAQLRLAILDYPGGWLKEPQNADQKIWKKCEQWIKDSSVIIVPIDSNLIMEADNKEKTKASRELLQVLEVEKLVRDWAKGRWLKQESGLLLFLPVKCETYFDDNGGIYNKSQELYQRMHQFYGDVIEAAQQEMSEKNEDNQETTQDSFLKRMVTKTSSYTIEYHPVDTIGCIELANANWEEKNGKLSLDCQYLVRNPSNYIPKRKPLGNIGVLNSICKHMVENRRNSGMFRKFWDKLSGNDKLLTDAINRLSQQKPGSRFKEIAKGNIAKRG